MKAAGPLPHEARRAELIALYRSHAAKVKGYFRRSGQGEGVAEELMQETFARALRGLPQFQGDSKLSTWLWTIARRVLLEHVRKPRLEQAGALGEPIDPDSLTVEPDLHLMGLADCMRRGFAKFSADHPERAQVIYLAVVEEYTREELGEFLGRTAHAATEYLSQCKAHLRPYIEHCRGH